MNEIHGNAISKKQPVFFTPRFEGVQEILSYCFFRRLINDDEYQKFQNPTSEIIIYEKIRCRHSCISQPQYLSKNEI